MFQVKDAVVFVVFKQGPDDTNIFLKISDDHKKRILRLPHLALITATLLA